VLMAIKLPAVVFLAFIYVSNVFGTCKKDCSQNIYSFDAFFTAHLDEDSIQLRDTLFLELTTPTQLRDAITNQIINFTQAANFGTDISFDKLLGNNNVQFCAGCFELKLINGAFLEDNLLSERNRDYRFEERNGQYLFKLAIIPKQKGTFCFAVGNASNVYRTGDKCNKANFSLTFVNTNQHLYQYEQSRPAYTPSEYERSHLYCFKVY
jgi:hypothetical protein